VQLQKMLLGLFAGVSVGSLGIVGVNQLFRLVKPRSPDSDGSASNYAMRQNLSGQTSGGRLHPLKPAQHQGRMDLSV